MLFRNSKRYLLMDRGTKFCESFRQLLDDDGAEPLRLPAKSLNLNAHLENFMGSIKFECLNRRVFFGRNFLRRLFASILLMTTKRGIIRDSKARSSILVKT